MPPQEEFYPRLTDEGIAGNPYWYSDNPFYQAGYGLPNCTCYAWGRFWEEAGAEYRPNLSTANAEDWYYYNDGYERGSTPALGAVLCLADGPFSGEGHVCVVEEIDLTDGSIVCSNSAWGGSYFYLTTLYPPDYLPASGYRFQGFIYNPHSGGQPIPPIIKKSGIFLFKRKLWRIEREL